MGAGGAQRVMATLANDFVAQGHAVTLLTLDCGSEPPFFSLDRQVRHLPLGLYAESGNWRRRIVNNLCRLWHLRRAIVASRPQVVVSFMDRTNILTLAATLQSGTPVIVAEHTAVGSVDLGWIWEALRRMMYPCAAAIVVLTERGRRMLPQRWQRKAVVIPNPVVLPPGHVVPKPGGAEKICLAMGSLRPEKGFDLLLQAFAGVAGNRPDWRLVILGEGPLHKDLERLAQNLGISAQVDFRGLVAEPTAFLKAAEIFVLSSRCEGFPLALCEAMACGLPVIAADCATGPREIVRSGVDGLLVETENAPALASAMARLMDDEPFRKELGRRAPEVLERFSLQRFSENWEKLLCQVVGCHV